MAVKPASCVVITEAILDGNSHAVPWHGTEDPYVTAAFLKLMTDAESVECATWQISNHEGGLVWMDEAGKCQNRTPSVSLHPQFYSKVCDDVWRGPMVLTGGVNEDGENHWLTMAEAEKLASSLNNGYPVITATGWYMKLLRSYCDEA